MNAKKDRIAKTCAHCGQEMHCREKETPYLWNRRKYCSHKCSREGLKVLLPFICEECSKEAFRKGKETKRRFCSPECMRTWRSRLWKDGAIKRDNHHIFSKGGDNPNWKGGITPVNELLRRTPEYRAWRAEVFKRDGYTCQLCGQKGGDLNADHIKPFSTHPELRHDVDNGRTLCVSCHRKTFIFYRNQYREAVV
jgi:hypothetical protein